MRIRFILFSCVTAVAALIAIAAVGASVADPPRPTTVRGMSTTSAPPPTTTTTTAAVEDIPAARAVFVEGDSLTLGAEPWLSDALGSVHWRATAIDAANGRKTGEGLAALAA